MKRLIVKLFGTVTSSASRSFVLEVPDDTDVQTLDMPLLEGIADLSNIHWEYHADDFVLTTDHSFEVLPVSGNSDHVIVQLEEKTSV